MLADHLLKKKRKYKKFNETGHSQYIYQNELEKTSFQQDMAYGDFNNLPRRTASDKALCNKAFNIARNLNEADQCKLASTDYKFFDKKSSNHQLAEELHEKLLENLKN